MENREILIANTRTQKRSKITTDATTLGELKRALTAAGIDYDGMTFTEGISKTQLLDDATQLPQNVMYKGSATNNLVILLTNTKKNIASGATGTRAEAKELLDSVEGLKDEVKRVTGKNWTIVSNETLWSIITDFMEEDEEDNDATDTEEEVITPANLNVFDAEPEDSCPVCAIVDTYSVQIAALVSLDILRETELKTLVNNINKLIVTLTSSEETDDIDDEDTDDSVSTSDGSITNDDIDDMIDELGV